MSVTNLSLGQGFVVFLAMAKLKRGIDIMILSLIIFVSPTMLSFGNIAHLLSSHSLPCLPIFLLCLRFFPDGARIPSVVAPNPPVVAPNSPVDFSVQSPDIFDPFPSSPFNEQVEDE